MDYHLKPLGKTCAATGDDLVPGTGCVSALVEREGELVRLDFALDQWNGPPEGTIAHWRRAVPEQTADRSRPLDPDSLLSCFEQLHEEASPATEKLRYVLALLLLQKRRLHVEGTHVDGETEYLELVGSRSEGPFLLRDQQLAPDEIKALEDQLKTHLATEWS